MLHLTVLHYAAPIITMLDLMLLLSQCLALLYIVPLLHHAYCCPNVLVALYFLLSMLYHAAVVHDSSCLQLSHVLCYCPIICPTTLSYRVYTNMPK